MSEENQDGQTMDNTSFTDMGVNDIGLGVALHNALKLSSFDLGLPDKLRKVQEISDFMNNHPDSIRTVERVARSNNNPNISQLDHFIAFVTLNKEKLRILDSLDEINNQIKFYG